MTWINILIVAGVGGISCASQISYVETTISDRHTNMLGLETLFLHYIEKHPEDWSKFIRVLTSADDDLHTHRVLTRAGVMRWINRQIKKEGFDEREMPGLFFLRSVYLQGWDWGYLNLVDENDRELLSDIISGVMGALHKCQTCTIRH